MTVSYPTAPSISPDTAPRTVTILGSTGSIGCNTLDIMAANPEAYHVVALTAHRNVALLAEQARKFRAEWAIIADESAYGDLKAALRGSGVKVAAGPQAIDTAGDLPAQWVMSSIVGAVGLRPTLSAIRRGATVALANKECLVCAGDLMMDEVKKYNATLVPVDSEHNAIFQVFDFERVDQVEQITLTASGGPFMDYDTARMKNVTPAQAVNHPNWNMGAKISVDSATMMNKGLEMIEAYHLFPVCAEQIAVIVHPQSVIHSMVSYVDGSVLAQMGAPDMRIPISFALAWPKRLQTTAPRLNLTDLGRMDFRAPDVEKFPALKIAREALHRGGTAPTILNAANEMAVKGFLDGEIGFLDIAAVVAETLSRMPISRLDSLDVVQAIDAEARRLGRVIMKEIGNKS